MAGVEQNRAELKDADLAVRGMLHGGGQGKQAHSQDMAIKYVVAERLTEEMEAKHVSNQSCEEGCLEDLSVIDVPLTIIRNNFWGTYGVQSPSDIIYLRE